VYRGGPVPGRVARVSGRDYQAVQQAAASGQPPPRSQVDYYSAGPPPFFGEAIVTCEREAVTDLTRPGARGWADFPYGGSANQAPAANMACDGQPERSEAPVSAAGASSATVTPQTVPLLEVRNLHVSVHGTEILHGVDLVVPAGELHALMGPNGSGKSTLAKALLAAPGYDVTEGQVLYKGEDITAWSPDARGKAGIFLAFQYPEEIPGVPIVQFLRQALSARRGADLSVLELRLSVMDWMKKLDMDGSFAERYLNEGFSGGEKKRNEVLQMAVLEPDFAVLDETDSGLDIDALKTVAHGVDAVQRSRPALGVLLITHYQRILGYLNPDAVHVLVDGRVVESGGPELAARLEREGYEPWRREQ